MVKNLPSNAGDKGLIPDQGANMPHATGQLSLCTTAREDPTRGQERSLVPQLRPSAAQNK